MEASTWTNFLHKETNGARHEAFSHDKVTELDKLTKEPGHSVTISTYEKFLKDMNTAQ